MNSTRVGVSGKGLIALVVIGLLLSIPRTNIRAQQGESMVRAAVVLGILRFTYWSENNLPLDSITLCDMGNSRVAQAFKDIKHIPKIGKRSVTLRHIEKPWLLEQCHTLLIGEAAPNVDLRDKNVLTICDDCEGAYQQDSAVALKRRNNAVRFDINLDHLDAQGISLSSSVLELARKCKSSNSNIRGCND